MPAIAILIDGQGNETFLAYGPPSPRRDKATRFANAHIATKAAVAVIFGNPDAFWNSERTHAENTRREHRGWSYRIEEVSTTDKRREGYWIARYPAGTSDAYEYLTGKGFSPAEHEATLFPDRPTALRLAQGVNRPAGYNIAVNNY